MMPPPHVGTFPDRHGVEVFFRQWTNEAPHAVVTIAHGASEHSGRYSRFAESLLSNGFGALALDHRGHGHTRASTGPGRMGPPGGAALVDDVDDLVDLAVRSHPSLPVVAFGHSMGALITLAHATQHADRLTAVILCGFPAPSEGLDELVTMFSSAVEAGMADEAIDLLSAANEAFEPARTPFDWLSRDAEEVDRYLVDPMCGNGNPLTYGFVAELFGVVGQAMRPEELARISCPVLLVTGDQDPAAGFGANADALASALELAGVQVTNRHYPGARHELLNELNRAEVTQDIIDWVLARDG
jgi:alpha-beta hydrolase superfamily lysophospholipase